MSRRVLRYGPTLLAALVAVATLACLELFGVGLTGRMPTTEDKIHEGHEGHEGNKNLAFVDMCDAEECAVLAELSELAAGRVGVLALVGEEDRRYQARLTAAAMRALAEHAAQVEHGEMLAVVLIDLADALEDYDLARITAASAANAALREHYTSCAINNLR